jgi:hypothetical protein
MHEGVDNKILLIFQWREPLSVVGLQNKQRAARKKSSAEKHCAHRTMKESCTTWPIVSFEEMQLST